MNINNSTNPLDQSMLSNETYKEPPFMKWIFRFVFVTVFIVGLIGNSVVCWTIIRRRRMRSSNYIFTFNLAFSDLVFVVFYVPSQMSAYENNHSWALGEAMCRIMYVILPITLSSSIGTLLAITGDRYRAVAQPMKPRITSYTMRFIIGIIWLSSFITALPVMIHSTLITVNNGAIVYCDEIWPNEIYKIVYWISIFVVQYLLPLVIILVLAVLIACHVKKNTKQLRKSMSKVFEATVRLRIKQTSKIIRILVVLVVLYTICMLPQHVVYLWWQFGDLDKRPYRLYIFRFANVFPMANSAFNPIAYGTLNSDFKKAFKRFFTCDFSRGETDENKTVRFHSFRQSKFRLSVYRNMSSCETNCNTRRGSFTKGGQHRKFNLRAVNGREKHTKNYLAGGRTLIAPSAEPCNVEVKVKALNKLNIIQSNAKSDEQKAELAMKRFQKIDMETLMKPEDDKSKLSYNSVAAADKSSTADHALKPVRLLDLDSINYDPISFSESVTQQISLKKYRKERKQNIPVGGDDAERETLIPSSDCSTDELAKPLSSKVGDVQLNENMFKQTSSVQETRV